MLQWLTLFTRIHKNDWFKKKATFVRSGKVEMISTFQRNRHFRKVLVKKTFTHVQEQKRAMSSRHSAYIPSSVKSPLLSKKTKLIYTSNPLILANILRLTTMFHEIIKFHGLISLTTKLRKFFHQVKILGFKLTR